MTAPIAIVLAAGKGTRMRSELPKVLHSFLGRPLIAHPLEAAVRAGAEEIVVIVGHGGAEVETAVREVDAGGPVRLRFVRQDQQLGTGHAILCALPELPNDDRAALILSGDVPLLRAETCRRLLDARDQASSGLALASFRPVDPTGYGRVVRRDDRVVGIVEQRDGTVEELAIGECNAGTYAVTTSLLHELVPRLRRDNAQGEMYLTDLVAMSVSRGTVIAVDIDPVEAAGVNTPEQLQDLERLATERQSPA